MMFDVYSNCAMAVSYECVGRQGRECQHRVFTNQQGIIDMGAHDVQTLYERFESTDFLRMMAAHFEEAGWKLDSRSLRLVLEYVWAPPVHFRRLRMYELLPVFEQRAEQTRFGELFTHRFAVDETTEDALLAICRSNYGTPAVVRKFAREFPAAPVTTESLLALCERVPDHEYELAEKETQNAVEIAFFLLSFPSCKIDHRVLTAARASLIGKLRSAFEQALIKPETVALANRRAHEAARARRIARMEMREEAGEVMLLQGRAPKVYDRGSPSDVELLSCCKSLFIWLRAWFV